MLSLRFSMCIVFRANYAILWVDYSLRPHHYLKLIIYLVGTYSFISKKLYWSFWCWSIFVLLEKCFGCFGSVFLRNRKFCSHTRATKESLGFSLFFFRSSFDSLKSLQIVQFRLMSGNYARGLSLWLFTNCSGGFIRRSNDSNLW
jgi:hypothetical protein